MNTAMNAMQHGTTHGGGMPHGKMAIEKLISTTSVTHTAIRSGAWSNAKTWKGGRIPGKGAAVLIQKGTTVTYDQVSEDDIRTIAVRGNLRFATDKNTQLRVETLINAPEGRIDIGSQSRSVNADKQARIIFTSDRAINTKWDPQQLTKGLLSHGTVNIYGADKKDKVRLAKNASAGDDTLTFKDKLSGWRIGDKIVLAGTSYSYNKGDKTNDRFQDEVLTIKEIRGKTIWFENDNASNKTEKTTLRFNHKKHSKLDANKIELYAANLSRNVSFETENGEKVPTNHRAHVMLMHNPNVKVLNAGFYALGRSDKTKIVDDVNKNVDGSKGNGTNPRGRYALHLHQTGLDSTKPILLRGNVVSGSPGWGIVQHESHAGLEDNVVFDVAGAGIVAESGNETGWWTDNITIKSTGVRWDIAKKQRNNRKAKFDFGFEGDGYWLEGAAQIANTNNVATSTNHAGIVLFSGSLNTVETFRPVKTIAVKDLPPSMRSLFPGRTEVDIRHVPTATVKGFEGYNNTKGIGYWGHGFNFDGELAFNEPGRKEQALTAHLGRSLIQDFTIWGARKTGVVVQYSSNLDLENGIVAGVDDDERVSSGRGVFLNHGTYNSVVDGVEVNGFREGVHFEQLPSDKNYNTNALQNSKLAGNTYNLSKVANETLDGNRQDDFGAFFKLKNNQFEAKRNNRAPIARFSSKNIGGLSVKLDASDSADPDPYVPGEGKPKPVASKGIAAYGWDVDDNGSLDYFGRTLTYTFSRPGRRTVGLSVLDSQGKVTTTKRNIDVKPTNYSNAFVGGDFGAGTPTLPQHWMDSTQWADQGWFASSAQSQISGGVAKLSEVGWGRRHIGQIVRNEGVHRGKQTLSFRLQNLEGSGKKDPKKNNNITVTLWGVNGQFDNNGWELTGPQQAGALPMQRTQLISQQYGGEKGKSFDWKTINLDVNLGKGYEYLLFQVNTTRSGDKGDRIAIDNVSLSGKSSTAPSVSPGNIISPVIKIGFDEASGAIAFNTADATGQSHAKLKNGARRVDSQQGKAVQLKGKKDAIILKGAAGTKLAEHTQRTVSMWFNANEANSANKQVLYDEGGTNRGTNIYLEDGLVHFGGWNQQFKQWKGAWIESTKGQIVSGKWHHVALVLEAEENVKDEALTAYLDGTKIGSTQGALLGNRPASIGVGNVVKSTRFADGISRRSNSYGLKGLVDEVTIFEDALSAQQVQDLMS